MMKSKKSQMLFAEVILKPFKGLSILFSTLGCIASFILLFQTPELLDRGRQAIFINEIFLKIYTYSSIPTFIYIILGYIISKFLLNKNTFKSLNIFTTISIRYSSIIRYMMIMFIFIGLCIAHTNLIWLIAGIILVIMWFAELVANVYLS